MSKPRSPIAATIAIDPLKLCPAASHEPLENNRSLAWRTGVIAKLKQRTTAGRLCFFLWKWIKSLVYCAAPDPTDQSEGVVFLSFTNNQTTALAPIVAELEQRGIPANFVTSQGGDLHAGKRAPSSKKKPLDRFLNRGRFLAAPFLPLLLLRLAKSSGYQRRSFSWAFDEYWHAFGIYLAGRRWFSRCRYSAVVLSNDHSLFPCVLEQAARDSGIPTYYMQHACITDKFPPLRTTFALLEGRDSLDKYARAGPSTSTVFLVGIARFDSSLGQINHSTQLERLGIAPSKADDTKRIELLLRGLANANLELKISIRLHPGMQQSAKHQIEQIAAELNLSLSSSSQTAFKFLATNDAIIAGTSAILLESALLNVTPIQHPMSSSETDWYGFLQNGLCDSFSHIDQLVNHLRKLKQHRPSQMDKTAYYCETAGGPFHGKSTQLAADLIASNSQEGHPVSDVWQRITSQPGLEAYGLIGEPI